MLGGDGRMGELPHGFEKSNDFLFDLLSFSVKYCLLFCSSRSDKATIIVMAIIFELVVTREVPSDLSISD